METQRLIIYIVIHVTLVLIIFPSCVQLRRRHRHAHSLDRHESNFTSDVITHKKQKCGIKLGYGCHCKKFRGSISISCSNAQLENVPTFQFGIETVRTLNLGNNRISDINLGELYGMKIERLLLSNNSLSQLNILAFWGLEYYLETLDISFNSFYVIPYAALRLLRHLRSLNLTANYIKSLQDNGFENLDKLEVLSLDRNPITKIDPHAFSGTNLYSLILDELRLPNGLENIPTKDLKTLKGLSVARNNIDVIPNQWFSNLTSLKYLNMDDNDLSFLPDDVFRDVCLSLQTVELNANKFRKVPKEALRLLVNLETLRMSHNHIKKIAARSFNCSRNLKILDMSKNEIREISNAAFHGLNFIEKIDLRDNNLITLDDRLFYWDSFANKEIYLSRNPWLCNCLVKWIKKEYRKDDEMIKMFVDIMKMRCARPDFLYGKPIVRLPLRDFTCDHDYYYYEYEDEAKNKDRGGDIEKEKEVDNVEESESVYVDYHN